MVVRDRDFRLKNFTKQKLPTGKYLWGKSEFIYYAFWLVLLLASQHRLIDYFTQISLRPLQGGNN